MSKELLCKLKLLYHRVCNIRNKLNSLTLHVITLTKPFQCVCPAMVYSLGMAETICLCLCLSVDFYLFAIFVSHFLCYNSYHMNV